MRLWSKDRYDPDEVLQMDYKMRNIQTSMFVSQDNVPRSLSIQHLLFLYITGKVSDRKSLSFLSVLTVSSISTKNDRKTTKIFGDEI